MPVTPIIGFTKLLMDRADLPADARRQLSLIDSAGASLMTVVDDILDFSKVEAGEIELLPAPVSMRRVAEAALAIVTPGAERKGLELKLKLTGPVDQPLMADEMRLRQVLLNLLNNAVKFTAEGRVELAVRVTPGDHVENVEFTITDTGLGIPLDRRDRLFVRFSQVDGSVARLHGGTGLGLAICKGLVELMDGVIGVKSAPGHGSVFWFEAPFVRAEAAAEAPQEETDVTAGLGLKVLLVDDHPMNRELGAALLTIMGCEFDLAENGEEAVEAVRGQAYDAILMDVHMPGMDGLAATRAIRAMEGPTASTPIIAMTADVLPEHVARCRAAGMDAHVSKPVRPEALYAALAACLTEPEAVTSAAGAA
jgi:CheY-like chemotaxis protein